MTNYWICLYRGQDQLIEAESWIQTRLNRRDRSPGSLTVICTIKGWLNVWSNCNVCHARVPGAQTKVIQHLLQIEVNCSEVYLEHTLLAISVLNCARGRCNTSRGYSMHEPKANEPNTLKQPAKCFVATWWLFSQSGVWDTDETVDWTTLNFKRSWSKLRAKLERSISEVGVNFERSWIELRTKLDRTSS